MFPVFKKTTPLAIKRKESIMKRITALLLTALMLLGLLAGCGGQTEDPILNDEPEENRFTFPPLTPPSIRDPEETDPEETTDPDAPDPIEFPELATITELTFLGNKDVEYVMIYNPSILSESLSYIPTKSTGSFGSQLDPYMNRSEALEEEGFKDVSPDELIGDLPLDKAEKDGDRANGYAPVYKVGDSRNFYCYPSNSLNDPRIVRKFSCRYAGEHCYIWVYNNIISDALAKEYGQEFDQNIYEQEVEAFGEPRYADMGGKIHLLYYPMQNEFAGCFCMLDLYASNEFSSQVVEQYGINTDHAIIHMNGTYAALPDYKLSMTTTMAHEFQHLICGSDDFYTKEWLHCPSWFNEAMSTYVETVLYPDYAEYQQNYTRLHNDYLIRHGQSMYSFNNITPDYQYDFSPYDSVYLYASYLARLSGDDVFSNFHEYWRYSGSETLNVVEAIANAVSEDTYEKVMDSLDYSDILMYEEAEFLSKLTLQFYLDLLDRDETDPEAFSTLDPTKLVYDELNPAEIEPGGRIIVALKGSTYFIPEDADTGLMYIGLDKDFNPVTNIIYN